MRGAYVCSDPGVPVFGRKGCSVHVQEMLRALRRAGADVELFAMRTGEPASSDLSDLRVHQLPAPRSDSPGARELALVAANDALRAALTARGRFDFVYERHALFATSAMAYARDAGIPGMLEINAPLVEEQQRHRVLTHVQLAEAARAEAFSAASALLPVSEELAAWLRRHPSATTAIEVTPNGVDSARFAAARPAARRFTLGFVGGLRPWHGLADLAAIFAAVRAERADAQLLVVGDGPGRAGLEADLAARGGLTGVTFAGAVAPDAVPAWLAAIDVALAPYPSDASFYFSPLKLFEYMAAGRAIVASAIGQIASVVRHAETGWLHAPGDVAGAARAALALTRDEALRAQLGAAAQSWVAAHRSWDAVATRVIALAVAGRPAGPSAAARGLRLELR